MDLPAPLAVTNLLIVSLFFGVLVWLVLEARKWVLFRSTMALAGFLLIVLMAFQALPPPALASQSAISGPIELIGQLDLLLTVDEQVAFEQSTLKLAAITRQKEPVLFYRCTRDIEHPGSYVFVERWPSQSVLEAHLQTEHFLHWWEGVKPHLAQELDVSIAPLDAFHRL